MIVTCYHCNTELLTQIEIDNHRCDLSEELKRLKAENEELKCCGNCDSWKRQKGDFLCLQVADIDAQLFRSYNTPSHRCELWEKRK